MLSFSEIIIGYQLVTDNYEFEKQIKTTFFRDIKVISNSTYFYSEYIRGHLTNFFVLSIRFIS
jgi:hypothetical protein